MGSTALVAFLMRIVDKRFIATQLAILTAFTTLPRILSGPVAVFLQSKFGWVGLYEISFMISLLFIPFLFMLSKESFFSLCLTSKKNVTEFAQTSEIEAS